MIARASRPTRRDPRLIRRATWVARRNRRSLTTWTLAAASACAGTSSGGTGVAPRDSLSARVPNLDRPSTLDVGTWNLEWFGDPGNGPTNEELQLEGVRAAFLGMQLDIIGVQEVVSQAQWDRLERSLPGYAGFLASEATVAGGATSYSPNEQKVGILYKTAIATPLGSRIVLPASDADFAGRPPLEVSFRVTVDGATRDLVVLVLHMKAFPDVDSWQRRTRAAAALKAWLDTSWPTQHVLVVGDWNDDLDASISPGRASPYANFVQDPARYVFPTVLLSVLGVSTTIGFPDAVDHHLVTNELAPFIDFSSVRAVRLDQILANYTTTTSDHLPVVVSYRAR